MTNLPLVLHSPEIYTLDRTFAHTRSLQFRGPRESAGFRVSGAPRSFYIAYLDEFGHVGPFISRSHESHKTSPVFGLGGIVLPAERVRDFASYFYRLKCDLLACIEKTHSPEAHDSKRLYRAVLREAIKRLNSFCRRRKSLFMIEYEDLAWVPKYFAHRLARAAPISCIRRQGILALGVEETCTRH